MKMLTPKLFLTIFLSSYSIVTLPGDRENESDSDVPVIKVSKSDGNLSRVYETDPRYLARKGFPAAKQEIKDIFAAGSIDLANVKQALYLLADKIDEHGDCHRVEMASAAGEIAANKAALVQLKARLAMVEMAPEKTKPGCCSKLLYLLSCGLFGQTGPTGFSKSKLS